MKVTKIFQNRRYLKKWLVKYLVLFGGGGEDATKKLTQAKKMHDVVTKHDAKKSQNIETDNRTVGYHATRDSESASRLRNKYKESRNRSNKRKSNPYMKAMGNAIIAGRSVRNDGITDILGEQYDYYDIILSHLLDEGYAETPEAAKAIMVNMSEEWRQSIIG